MPSFSNRNDYKSRRSTPNNSQHVLGIFSNEIRVLHWPRRVYWAIVLVKRGLQFRENLTKKYKWNFSSEPEDYAPQLRKLDHSITSYCLQWIFVQVMTAPALGQNPAPCSQDLVFDCLQHKSWEVCSIQNTLGIFLSSLWVLFVFHTGWWPEGKKQTGNEAV